MGRDSSVGRATGYGLDGPGMESRWRARFSAPVQTDLGAHPASCTIGTDPFPGIESGRGVTLTPNLLLVSWSRKSRAIPLLSLWAAEPVQSLSACKRCTLIFYSFFNLGARWSGWPAPHSGRFSPANGPAHTVFIPECRVLNRLYFKSSLCVNND